MRIDRRQALAIGAAALAFGAKRARAQTPCPAPAAIDEACAPLLALLPEAASRAGLGADPARLDDQSPDGDAALAMAVTAALAVIPAACADEGAAAIVRAPLAAADATRAIRYGRNDPTAAIHRPYRVTAFAGPPIETPRLLALAPPPIGGSEPWLARLDGHADALAATAEALRADEAAGCAIPVSVGRGALATLDAIVAVPVDAHPLARAADPATNARAAAILSRRVQPATAALRDTVAALTRRGAAEPGLWRQPDGEALYAANVARAGDATLPPAEAQSYARDEAARIAALLDRRLALRGFRDGPLDARIAAAFAERPALFAGDDAEGRAALLAAARDRMTAAHAALDRIVPAALAATPPPEIAPLPDFGRMAPPGSLYARAGGVGTLWLDLRSVYALPIPGVGPLAYRLGLPGEHLLASTGTGRPAFARACAWPAMTAGWRGYAARLAAEQGLFARDPWGDIARLADELAAAARLVVDVGIHRQRWTRARAETEMTSLTGAPRAAAIDRIEALPGEAAAETLGLRRLLTLRDRARGGAKRFDARPFHMAVLAGGARPFAVVERAVA
jgi:uncharacterized protein (DUF885 family)